MESSTSRKHRQDKLIDELATCIGTEQAKRQEAIGWSGFDYDSELEFRIRRAKRYLITDLYKRGILIT